MVYRGSTLIASGIPGFDGRQVDGIEYMTREKFMCIMPDRGKYYYVVEHVAPEILGAVAAGAVAGTKFTAAYMPRFGVSYESILTLAAAAADAPNYPNFGVPVPTAGAAYTSGADIAAAVAGDVLSVYAINTAGQVVGFFQKVLAEGDIKA